MADEILNLILSTLKINGFQSEKNGAAMANNLEASLAKPPGGLFENFAKCLKSKQATMFGAEWCPHCQNEKKSFGTAWRYVPYVECVENPGACSAAGIEGYPTWVLEDGTKLFGEQNVDNFKELANATACPAPTK